MAAKDDGIIAGLPRTNPNRYEHTFLLHLMIIINDLCSYGERTRERMKPYKFFWRDLRCAQALLEKIENQMLFTIPEKRLRYYYTMAQRGQIVVDLPGPSPARPLALIDVELLAPMAETVVKNECALCCKSGKDIARCKLRDGLMTIVPPDEVKRDHNSMCEYAEHANALLRDDDE